jgi:hypothetical protein
MRLNFGFGTRATIVTPHGHVTYNLFLPWFCINGNDTYLRQQHGYDSRRFGDTDVLRHHAKCDNNAMAIDDALTGWLAYCLCFSALFGGGEGHVTTRDRSHGSIINDHGSSLEQIRDAVSTMFDDSFGRIASVAATCPTTTVHYITCTIQPQCLISDYTSVSASALNYEFQSATDAHSHVSGLIHSIKSIESLSTSTTTVTGASSESSSEPSQPASVVTESIGAIHGPPTHVVQRDEDEGESPLDNANFLSFEEWKNQNLAKAGQSPENMGRSQNVNMNRPRPDLVNALDALGDEGEIDLDFTGFGSGAAPTVPVAAQREAAPEAVISDNGLVSTSALTVRSKDAGKTCKERTNYASFDCAATALKSNKECKSASAILVENKDSYLLNKCSADNKFIIVELCDDILVDTVVLANYEFFSSSFRHFRISVSDRYPVKIEKWKDLGTYEARNTREIQAFLVQNPLIWARYLRIEFLTHYGNEYYCPVSLLRVHGTTMLEEFRHQEDAARGDDEEVAAQEASIVLTAIDNAGSNVISAEVIEGKDETTVQIEEYASTESNPEPSATAATSTVSNNTIGQSNEPTIDLPELPNNTQAPIENPNATCEASEAVNAPSSTEFSSSATISEKHSRENGPSSQSRTTSQSLSSAAGRDDEPHIAAAQKPLVSTSSSPEKPHQLSKPAASAASRNSTAALSGPKTNNQTLSATETTRSASGTAIGSQPPQPSTQESFFKSVHKRLQQLESNSTLSLQYIEEQSRILRDAFTKVEKRQVSTTSNFLANLNQTVISELQGLRQAYDHLWQSTVIELEGQRQLSQHEMLAMSARLTMVADELVWQKRMGILQSALLLLCLALVLFGRTSNGYLEMPIMQQMMNRSTAALRTSWESPPASPSPESRSPVSMLRQKLWRASPGLSGNENLTDSDKEGLEVRLEPPTPSSQLSMQSEDEEDDDSDELEQVDELVNQPEELDSSNQSNDRRDSRHEDTRASEAPDISRRLSENT